MMIQIEEDELRELLTERNHLRLQVSELQAQMTTMVETSQARRVRAFHAKFGHLVQSTPAVPAEELVRFRIRLVAEEFLELIDATFDNDGEISGHYSYAAQRDLIRCTLALIIQQFPIDVDMVDFADAMTDLDYVVEGTRATFGIDGAPAFSEVQRANMDKDPNGPDGKPIKPLGWRAPDIDLVLRRQGWSG